MAAADDDMVRALREIRTEETTRINRKDPGERNTWR